MVRLRRLLTACYCLLALPSALTAAEVDFDREIASIFVRRCVECHQGASPSGGLNLTRFDQLLAGGESGKVLKPGDAAASELWRRVRDGEMPPPQRGRPQPLQADEVNKLKTWIDAGTPWPKGRVLDLYEATSDVRAGRDWWSLQPVVRPPVPEVHHRERVANPIDAFVLARLERERMEPAPLESHRRLLRRLYHSVWGLAPAYEQLEAFDDDRSPDAWHNQVDRVLSSPLFGQRWARYWLDVVRYAETSGYERDQEKPFAWKYRDWVVNAINADMPYDRFVAAQLAGDELPDRSRDSVIATGFLRLGTWNDEPNDDADYRYDRLEDLVHSTSSAFLGLTVKCARCHDHKFDPIPQVDYYRIASAFWAGPVAGRDRKYLGGPTPGELGHGDILGWTDLSRCAPPLHVLKNGERHAPLGVAEPGPLSAIPATFALFKPPPAEATTTQRRLQLAHWIASDRNPLTARVIVNRIWQHHFGAGIVRSPNNFGFRGSPPTHPALLDWLAAELMDHQWNLLHIHRLILTSTTWRQSTIHPHDSAHATRDFDNQFWWRSNRRRLDAEALRDRLLHVSGDLDLRLGGPSFRPTIAAEALEGLSRRAAAWTASPPPLQQRRGLYMYTKRHLISPFMNAFDFCDTTLPCGQRDVSTVAPQALALLNHAFVHRQSEAVAREVAAAAGDDPDAQAATAWKLVLGRLPAPPEQAAAVRHLRLQRQRFTQPESPAAKPLAAETLRQALVFHMVASQGVTTDEQNRVVQMDDQSGKQHHARQTDAPHRPRLVLDAIHEQPALRFDGGQRYLTIDGNILATAACTIVAVARDVHPAAVHRSIVSNWNHRNSTTSLFLGLTGQATVRWSDQFSAAGAIAGKGKPFLLTAVNGRDGAHTYQSTTLIASRATPLTNRNLATPWVIGQQGNINGEYWQGDIAEIRIYHRPLTHDERQLVWQQLIGRYGLAVAAGSGLSPRVEADPALLALASLCHVLLNSNEFVYVD